MLVRILQIFTILIAVGLAACASEQSTSSQPQSGTGSTTGQSGAGGDPKSRSMTMNAGIDLSTINKAADMIGGYSPGGKGFPYKGTAIDQRDFDAWAGKHKGEVQKVLDQIVDGYKLQVTGHTDNVGPREADAPTGRKGNVFYSTERAKAVHDALVRAGLPAAKMTYKGIADDELLKGVPGSDGTQRRVTFKVVEVK